jgi:hypothetical protein
MFGWPLFPIIIDGGGFLIPSESGSDTDFIFLFLSLYSFILFVLLL